MRKSIILLTLLFSITVFSVNAVQIVDCTVEIPSEVVNIDGSDFIPGDVICLLAGNKDYLLLKDIQGTEVNPITIINSGGPVIIDTDHFYGVKFDNCKHVIFSGAGEPGIDYGIQIKEVSNGAGISVDLMSTNVEIEYIEVSNTSIAGIYAKTEPYQGDCDNMITRDKFTMYDIEIHNCYLHDIADEGLYIGSSKYTGQTIYDCNDIVVLPHVIEGVQVYNNLVVNTGWDGIQVSSTPEDCNIYNNVIINDSYEEFPFQMSGILIGGGSECDCYNNKIFDGKGDGIDVLGLGNMKIYNNLIVRAGRSFMQEAKHGIWVGEVVTNPNTAIEIYNNTIISPNASGIKYANNDITMGFIKNNLITNPGLLATDPDIAYINIASDPSKVESSNNFNVANNSIPKFIDAGSDNYDLRPNSFAVNYGTSLTNQGITFDIENRPRPFHTYFDAGAYECHDPNASINEVVSHIGNPYPSPAKNTFTIPLISKTHGSLEASIINLQGVSYYNVEFENYQNNNELTLHIDNIPSGSYILNIKTGNYSVNRSIVIIK